MSYTDFDFPHTHFYDSDLRELIRKVFELNAEVKNFVSINAIKYADPIQWNITRQYEKNTIVIDELTGIAYLSVQTVPKGIALNRTEYWTPVFDLSRFITQGNKNLTTRVENAGVVYSTFHLNENDWVVWNGTLYKALDDLPIGTAYSPEYNIEEVTVEEYVVALTDALSDERYARVSGDNALSDRIDDEEVARINADGNLNELTTTDKTNLVAAINEVNQTGGGAINLIGDLNDLTTTNKSNVVAAINEVNDNKYKHFVNVKTIGVVGDGLTDDTTAIQNAIDNYDCIYFPSGEYLISDTINITTSTIIAGSGTLSTFIIRSDGFTGSMFEISNAISCEISSLRIANGGKLYNVYNIANRGITIIDATSGNYKFDEVWIDSGAIGFYIENSANIRIVNCTVFQESAFSNNGYMTECGMQFFGHCTGIWIDNCFVSGQDASSPYFMRIGLLVQGADGIYVTNTGVTAKIGVFFTNQYAYVDDVYFTNCVFDNCTQSFVGSESAGSSNVFNNIMFDNCHMDTVGGLTGGLGIVVDYRIMNFKLSNSFVGGCSGSAIKLLGGSTYNNNASHDHSITNCYIVGANQANLAGEVGIAIQAAGCTVNGNTITNNGIRTGHAKYALTIEANDVLVSSNRLDTMETDYIYQQGGVTNTLRAANLPSSIND